MRFIQKANENHFIENGGVIPSAARQLGKTILTAVSNNIRHGVDMDGRLALPRTA